MKIMTIYNAKEKTQVRIETLEYQLGDLGNKGVWNMLMRRLRQSQKFTERLVALIQWADEVAEK